VKLRNGRNSGCSAGKLTNFKIIDVRSNHIRNDAGGVACRIENVRVILELEVADDRRVENIYVDRISKKDENSAERADACQLGSRAGKPAQFAGASSVGNMTKG